MSFLSESVSPYIFQKQNKSNSIGYRDDFVEKGETDCLRKENVLSGSEDEEKYNNAPPKEKKFKQDHHVNLFPNQRSVYMKTTEDKEKGVKIVTTVSVNDREDSFPKIMFQQSHEPLSEGPSHSLAPVTNIMKINCSGSQMKLEIQEILHLHASGTKTTFVFMNKGDSAETLFDSRCEKTWMPDNESPERLTGRNADQKTNYRFTFGEQTEAQSDPRSVRPTKLCCGDCCSGHTQQISTDSVLGNHLLNVKPPGKRKHYDQFWDIPPPQEFADIKYNSLEDLTHDLASCRIGAFTGFLTPNVTCKEESEGLVSVEVEERADLSPSFDQLSESDNYEPLLMRPSLSTNRSSFTKDFINYQKKKSCIRNNSIATVEHRACLLPKKRRQTFPGMSGPLGLTQEDLLLPYSESFSSLIMCPAPLQTEGSGNICQGDFCLSGFRTGHYDSSQRKGSYKPVSEIPDSHDGKQSLLSPFYVTSSEDNSDDLFTATEQCRRQSSIGYHQRDVSQQDVDLKQSVSKHAESLDTDDCGFKVDQSEVADSGFDQEMGEVEYHSPEPLTEDLRRRALTIQVIPPSCSGSEEQMLQSHPAKFIHNSKVQKASQEDLVSVMTALEQMDSASSPGSRMEKQVTQEVQSEPFGEKTGNPSPPVSLMMEETDGVHTEDSDKPAVAASCPAGGSTDTEIHTKEQLSKTDKTDKQPVSRCKLLQCL